MGPGLNYYLEGDAQTCLLHIQSVVVSVVRQKRSPPRLLQGARLVVERVVQPSQVGHHVGCVLRAIVQAADGDVAIAKWVDRVLEGVAAQPGAILQDRERRGQLAVFHEHTFSCAHTRSVSHGHAGQQSACVVKGQGPHCSGDR